MKTFIKKYWSVLLLIIILLVISVLSFVPNKYLLSNDNYSPELNPVLTIIRSLISPAWRSYRVLGFASDSEQADIFRTGLLGLIGLIAPSSSLSQIFSLICLWTGVLSMAFLTRAIVKDFVKTKYPNVVLLLAGVIYMTTLWTAWVYNFNMMPYITQFGFLPLLLLSLYWLFEAWSPKRLLMVFICSLLFTATSVIATLFFVDIIIIVFFIFFFGYLFRIKFKKLIIAFGIFFLTQLFWLLPFVNYTFSTSVDVINSSTNRSITADTIDLEKQMMTLENSARFYTRLLGTVDDSSQDTFILPNSNDYLNYDFYKVLAFVPLFFSIVGLGFIVFKKRYSLTPLWFLLFVLLFLLKNQNPPLGGVYIWLQNTIPLFKEVFRWVSSKLCQPYLIALTITASIGFLYFVDFLRSFFKGKMKSLPIIIFFTLTIAGLLVYAGYLFTGNLFTQRATVSLPSEYSQLADYLKNDNTGRIYYAPPSNNGYFREYSWGFVGSQFLGYLLPNPLMDMSLSIGSGVGEDAMLKLSNDFESGASSKFNNDLEQYDVKYVLVDRSLVKGRYGYALDWDLMDSYTKDWSLVWKSDFLELYEIAPNSNITYSESLNSTLGTFTREESGLPNLYAFNSNIGSLSIDLPYITRSFVYTGKSEFLSLDASKIDQSTLPTTLILDNNENISITPAIPIIADVSLKSKKILDISKNFDYVIASDKVISKSDLQKGVTIQDSWGTLNALQTTALSDFQQVDFTDLLKKTNPGDCSGNKYTQIPNVTPEVLASGFSIEGTTGLPCVSTKLNLVSKTSYAVVIHMNWESSSNSLVGICLYSNNEQKCLNNEKYFSTTTGYGDENILVPQIVSGNDDISLSVYALNPSGNEAKVTVRNVSLSISNNFETLKVSNEIFDKSVLTKSVITGDKITIKIPIIYGRDSYVYTASNNKSIWQPNTAKNSSEEYSVYSNDGMVQKVFGQYLNQYENVLKTIANEQYLWVWEGQNFSNIPSSVCLTYQEDDKCWVDDTFYDTKDMIVTKLFTTSSNYTKLDASYNSTSDATETENILKNFIVMRIPSQWLGLGLVSTTNDIYSTIEAKSIMVSSTTLLYELKSTNISDTNVLLTIPQAQSSGWVALAKAKNGIKILGNSVTVNGWKQGWDISNLSFNTIYIFYWPNLLGYLGYVIVIIEFVYLLVKVFKRRYHARR